MRKGLTHARGRLLDAICRGLSKNALIDCIGDYADLTEQDTEELIEFLSCRLAVRGDPEPQSWKPGALRRLPRAPL